MQTNVVLSIAKKEIMDNIRNKWIILVAAMFAILTLVVSYFGSLGTSGWQDLGLTISGMTQLGSFLISIVAFMLGYATIIGEIERGSMSSLLSLSANRFEIVVGKWLGLGAVLCFTILVGYGFAGMLIALNVSNVDILEYLVFIGLTMIFGLVFLTVALFFSTVFSKRSTALGGAIFLWFLFNIILPIVFVGLLATTIDFTQVTMETTLTFPDWYFALNLFNPISVYSSLITIAIGPVQSSTGAGFIPNPSWYTTGLLLGVLLAWIIVFYILSVWRFQRKDI
ncbi:MAG TPA: ABC transporter permease subunit [Candidatus Thermoplasmatota archaeon]|nr:ABC transporter permease subunit [Candidatus Thermoplasmatota archaeon]